LAEEARVAEEARIAAE
jgi:hypothetical protein